MGKFGITEIIVLVMIVPLYFVPAIIASSRRAADKTGIFLLNLFLGWTFLGWIGSLIWACVGKKESMPMIFNINNRHPESAGKPEQPKEEDFGKKVENIQKLKELFDSGAITQEEFNLQKAKLLS